MQSTPKRFLNRLIDRINRNMRTLDEPNTIDLLQSNNVLRIELPRRLVYAKEISLDRMIFRAVHQSLANKRNEKIIQPENIHREIESDTAGLT